MVQKWNENVPPENVISNKTGGRGDESQKMTLELVGIDGPVH